MLIEYVFFLVWLIREVYLPFMKLLDMIDKYDLKKKLVQITFIFNWYYNI